MKHEDVLASYRTKPGLGGLSSKTEKFGKQPTVEAIIWPDSFGRMYSNYLVLPKLNKTKRKLYLDSLINFMIDLRLSKD